MQLDFTSHYVPPATLDYEYSLNASMNIKGHCHRIISCMPFETVKYLLNVQSHRMKINIGYHNAKEKNTDIQGKKGQK